MAKDYAKQIDFKAGEISPQLYGDSASEFYTKGLETAENITISRRGGAFKKEGLRYLYSQTDPASQKDSGWRVFTKQINKYRFDKIILSDDAVYLENTGRAYTGFNLITNPDFAGGSFTGWFIPFTDWPTSYTLDGFSIHIKGYLNTFSGNSVVAMSTDCTVFRGIGDSHFLELRQATASVLTVKIGTSSGNDDIASFTSDQEVITFSFIPNNATYWVSLETDANTAPEGNIIYFVGSAADADRGDPIVDISVTTPPTLYDRTDLQDVHMITSPDGTEMLFLHPKYEPVKLNYVFGLDTYILDTSWIIPTVGEPAEWTGNNWPSIGAYHQGRLFLAGTPDEPQRIWASQSGDYGDFRLGTGLDGEGLDITMQRDGRITWMFSARELLIGAENGEHILNSREGVITPSDFQFSLQSTNGGARIQPLQVGEKIFYVSLDRRRIYTTAYYNEENAWLSEDIAFAAEHVTEGLILRMAWAQNPNAILHLVMESGEYVSLTYDKFSQVLGWCRNPNPNLKVFDIAVGSINGKDMLTRVAWVTEAERPHMEQATDKTIYMETNVHFVSNVSTTTVTGLDHLEGKTVQVLVDGAVSPEKVVSGGSITTSDAGTDFIVGLQISAKIKTLPPDVPQGQIKSWKKRWNKLWVLLHLSLYPKINGRRPPDRNPGTPMGTPEPLVSGHSKMVDLGWDENGQVTIEEDQPVPMNVLSIYGERNRESL